MIGHALHPTSMYIYTYVLRISITTLYSCACGGGSLHHQFCMDYIPPNADKWTDTSNFGCKWYSIYIPGSYEDDDIAADDDYYYEYYEGHDRCTEFGDHNTSPDGYTAMTACCACGGGIYGNTCIDTANFVDALGQGCDHYGTDPIYDTDDEIENSYCLEFGHDLPNADGVTADEACCVCGGGAHDYIGQPSVSPTGGPSVSPTDRPSVTPTVAPSVSPSVAPSGLPSVTPSVGPTGKPSVSPTVHPTAEPSNGPTGKPSVSPTVGPTVSSSVTPSKAPIVGTASPIVTMTSSPVVTTTMSPVTSSPIATTTMSPVTSSPVATTMSPVTSSPTVAMTQFNMTFDRMDCNQPLDATQKAILANMTSEFLAEEAPFEITGLDVVEVQDCDATMARQLEGYGEMEFTMAIEALVNNTASSSNGGGGPMALLKEHIEAKFNDTEAVNMWLNEIRGNEQLSTFEMVFSLAVQVLEEASDNSPSVAPTVSPSKMPVVASSTTTSAPVMEIQVTGAPVNVPADTKSAAAVLPLRNVLLLSQVVILMVTAVLLS